MAIVASQLVAQVSVTGVQQAQNSLRTMGTASDLLARKFADFKPFQAGKAVTQEDVLKSRLAQIEVQVEKTRAKLQTLQNAANAGQAVVGIPETLVKLNSLEVRAQQTRDKIAALQEPTVSFGSKLKQLASSAVEAGSSLAGRLASGIGSVISGIGSGIGSLISFGGQVGMAIFGLQQLVQTAMSLGQAMLAPNASMEQTRVAFIQLLGSSKAADKELRELAKFAADTPFEFPDLANSVQQLLAFQFDLKYTKPLLTAIGDALSALGRNTPATLDQVVRVFGQMNAAGKIMTGDLQQLQQVGINGFQILADQMHKPIPVIREMVERGVIPANEGIEMLRKGMEKMFGGGMQAQSRTFLGLWSTLQDNIGAAWRAFSGPLFDKAKDALTQLGNLVQSDKFQKFAEDMGKKVGGALKQVSDFINTDVVPAFQRVSDFVQTKVVPAFQTLANWGQDISRAFDTVGFQDLITSLQKLGSTISDIVTPALQPLVDGIKAFFSADNSGKEASSLADGFESIAQGIDGVRGGIEFMRDSWPKVQAAMQPVVDIAQRVAGFFVSTFGPSFKQIGDIVQKQLNPAFQQLWKAIQPALPLLEGLGEIVGGILLVALGGFIAFLAGVASAIAGALPGIVTWFTGIIQFATGFVQTLGGIFQFFTDLFRGNFSKLGADLGQIWAGIVNMFFGAINAIKGLFMAGLGWVTGFVSGWWQAIVGYFTQLWDTLVGHSIVPDMINAIVDWFGKLPGRVFAFLQNLVGGVGQRFTDLKNNAVSVTASLFATVTTWWSNISKTISDKATELKNNILRPFQQARDAMTGIAKSIGNAAIDGLNVGIHGAVDFVNRFADAINSVASALGQKGPIGHLKFDGIPHYAKGTPGGGHPEDGPAIVGEKGREMIWLPKGAHVIPHDMTEKLLKSLSLNSVPGYASGTPGVTEILGWIGDGAQGILNHMISAFHITPPSLPGQLSSFAGAVFSKVKDWALGWLEQALPSFGAGGQEGGGDFGTPVSGDLRSWILAGMALTHAPMSWFNALSTIAMHESGGNPSAVNDYDINAQRGDPSRGLFQTIMSTFMAYALPGHLNIFSPVDNAAAAIGYIRSRYGSVFNVPGIVALSQGKPYVGYRNGGWLTEPIVGMGLRTGTPYSFVEDGKPEYVSPAGYMPAGTSAIASGGAGSGGVTHVHIHTTAELNIDGARLARMQMPEIVQLIRSAI